MKKKAILLTAVILLSTTGLVQAQDNLLVVTDVTYATRCIWRGFDWYAHDHSAIQPSVNVTFWDTGFGMNVLWSRAVDSGFENKEWIVYGPYYGNSCWQGQPYQMNYVVGWRYYNHPDGPLYNSCHNRDLDFQECYARLNFPDICPQGFVPYYECARIWPDKGGRRSDDGCPNSYFRQYGGWFHTFGVSRDWTVPGFLPDTPEQVIHTTCEMVYNDGAGPCPDATRNNVDQDWSHAVFGTSTDFLISETHSRLIFTPGFYYQSSWEDSVNTSDEYWFTLSLKYEF